MGDTKELVNQAGIEAKSLRHSGFNQAADVIERLAAITAHLEQQEEIHHSILDEWGVGRADDGGNVWSIIGRINELGSHKDDLEQQLRWRDVTEEPPELKHETEYGLYSDDVLMSDGCDQYVCHFCQDGAWVVSQSGTVMRTAEKWKPITAPEGE